MSDHRSDDHHDGDDEDGAEEDDVDELAAYEAEFDAYDDEPDDLAELDDEDDGDGDGVEDEEPYVSTPRVHPAIFASNWRTVLVVDGAVGVAILLVGVALAIAWNPVIGGFIGSLGFVYVALIWRRGQDWAQQRRDAGL